MRRAGYGLRRARAQARRKRAYPNIWFAIDEDQPLFFFAGIWTRWTGKRKAKEEPADHELFAFLTTGPNAVVAPVHKKAMPVILTELEEIEAWLAAPWQEARQLRRPLADDRLRLIDKQAEREVLRGSL